VAQPQYTPSVAASIAACTLGVLSRLAVGQPSSFEPRWKPVTTLAANSSGCSKRRTPVAAILSPLPSLPLAAAPVPAVVALR